MTTEQQIEIKAKELVRRFEEAFDSLEVDSEPGGGGWITSESTKSAIKQSAIICIDEIIKVAEVTDRIYKGTVFYHIEEMEGKGDKHLSVPYWEAVKEKIKTLKPKIKLKKPKTKLIK